MTKRSAVKLTLTRINEKGDVESEQVTIRKMRFRYFTRALQLVTEIIEEVDKTPELRGLIIEMLFGVQFDRSQFPGKTKEELDEMEKVYFSQRGNRFMAGLYSSFRTLLAVLPEQTLELVAVMAHIDKDLMLDQEPAEGFDVINAVIEVNDIEELVVRGKQSFTLIQSAFEFMKPEMKEAQNVLANAPQQ